MDINDLKNFGKMKPKYKVFKQQPPLFLVSDSEWGETFYHLDRRYYTTPEGNFYPSVTTFIGYFGDDDWKAGWIERLTKEFGTVEAAEAEAERISERACNRGNDIHECLDLYVNNSPKFDPDKAGQFRFMLNQIRRVLDRKLDSVYYTEHAMRSDKLKIAGRCDLAGSWSGFSAIIDYKNKNRMAKREDIAEYFLQGATYALMHMEMYGSLPEKIVILVSVEDPNVLECQVFEEWTRDWTPKVIQMARTFQSESGYYDGQIQNRKS